MSDGLCTYLEENNFFMIGKRIGLNKQQVIYLMSNSRLSNNQEAIYYYLIQNVLQTARAKIGRG